MIGYLPAATCSYPYTQSLQLLQGARSLIEAGHSIIDCGPDSRICGCGQHGCIEAYASANSVLKRTNELLQDPTTEDSILKRVSEPVSTALVFEAASKGDALAARIVDDTAR